MQFTHPDGDHDGPAASGRAPGRGLVGVVLPHLGRWWFGEVVAGLDAVLRPAGYDLLLYPVQDAARRQECFETLSRRHRVDALVVVALPLTPKEIAIVSGLGIPVGCVGILTPGVPSVAIDESRAARLVTEHLLALGHTRIALIGGDPHEPFRFTAAQKRRDGYRHTMHAHQVWPADELDVPGSWTPRGAAAATRRLWCLSEPPTAVFAMSDEMALGVLCALHEAGVRVPQEVSVAGFDDHPDAELFGLTTVAQPAHDCGARLASLLAARLSCLDPSAPAVGPRPIRPVLRPRAEHVTNELVRLVIRTSTGPVRQGP